MSELVCDCSDCLERSDDDLETAERLSQRIKALCASVEGG
jgi:hypothetical protein